MIWKLNLSLHKGNVSSTTTYTPSPEEREMQQLEVEFGKYLMPNAKALNNSAANMFFNSIGDTQVDFAQRLRQADAMNNQASQGFANLQNGRIPLAYQQAMENSIKSGVQNTIGQQINSLADRGVLNSSVTNTVMNNTSKNVSDTMAEQYSNNIGMLSGLYGQTANQANSGITSAAAAQEGAQQPAINAWNMSLGLGNQGTGVLSAIAGQGTTNTSQSGGSNGLFGGLTSLASAGIMAFCFTEETKIKMADGSEKLIRNIKPGDKVLSYNPDNEQTCVETVEFVAPSKLEMVYTVVCRDDNDMTYLVHTTLSQPLLTEKGDMQEVALLCIGAKLKNAGRIIAIVESGHQRVFDFKTTGSNIYYANGLIALGAYDEEGFNG